MKHIKISLIVLTLLALLLMAGSPASAEANRIYFNITCEPESEVIILDPPHFSGPNLHLTAKSAFTAQHMIWKATPSLTIPAGRMEPMPIYRR